MAFQFNGQSIPCPHCRSDPETHEVIAETDRKGNPLRTVLCPQCGHVFVNPMPTPEESSRFYADEYRASYKSAITPKPRHVLRSARIASKRYQRMAPLLSDAKSVLDLGCASGELLHVLRAHGHEATGIEPNRGYAEYGQAAYGVDLRIGDFHQFKGQVGPFDAVISFHVFEHLVDPDDAFGFVRSVLKPGGLFIIEVPNMRFPHLSYRGRFHFGHVQHFSPDVLASFARRHGFVCEDWLFPESGSFGLVLRASADQDDPLNIPEPGPETVERIRQIAAAKAVVRERWLASKWAKLRRNIVERIQVRGKTAPEAAFAEFKRQFGDKGAMPS
jgi:SAM-dependent methyltransferase